MVTLALTQRRSTGKAAKQGAQSSLTDGSTNVEVKVFLLSSSVRYTDTNHLKWPLETVLGTSERWSNCATL